VNIRRYIWAFLFLLSSSLLLAFFVPPDTQIGSWVKIIYFHASMARNSVYFFVLAGIVSLISFFKKELLNWALSFESTAILFWIIQTILGFFIMKFVWGGFLFTEPKAILAATILFLSLLLVLIVDVTRSVNFFRLSSVVLAFLLVYLLLNVKNVFHPTNAIGASPSILMKILFEVITLITFFSFLFLSLWFKEGERGLKVQSRV
jgi:hypothetical protein